MAHKLPENKKKDKFTITINEKLDNILNSFLKENDLYNKSKYIESLIYKDMEFKGKKIKKEF